MSSCWKNSRCKFASKRTAVARSPRNGALVSWVQGLKHNLASDAIDADLLFHVLVVRLERHVAGQVIILVRHLRVAHIVSGRGMRRGALYECMLTEVSSVRTRPRPHHWGSSWEGLTQTRPALLPYAGALRGWVPKSRGPGGSGLHGWGRTLNCDVVGLLMTWETEKKLLSLLPTRGKPGNWRLGGDTDSCMELARETMSSCSIAVSVSKSSTSWSPGPPSRAGTCFQWCRALSIVPSALAEGFGRSARATAALRRRRATWISCFPPAME